VQSSRTTTKPSAPWWDKFSNTQRASGGWGLPSSNTRLHLDGEIPLDHLREGRHRWLGTRRSAAGNSQTNLARGRFRILIAVDRISAELRGIIEYVNSQPGDLPPCGIGASVLSRTARPRCWCHRRTGTRSRWQRSRVVRTGLRYQTLEDHLAQHPEARVLHNTIASVLSRYYPTAKQISYAGRWETASLSVIQLYLPERRVYFPGSPVPAITEAGGDLNELLKAAQQLGLRTTQRALNGQRNPENAWTLWLDS